MLIRVYAYARARACVYPCMCEYPHLHTTHSIFSRCRARRRRPPAARANTTQEAARPWAPWTRRACRSCAEPSARSCPSSRRSSRPTLRGPGRGRSMISQVSKTSSFLFFFGVVKLAYFLLFWIYFFFSKFHFCFSLNFLLSFFFPFICLLFYLPPLLLYYTHNYI